MRTLATLAALALLALAGGALYRYATRPGREPLDPYRREAARLVAERIAATIRTDNDLDGPVLLLPLAGDKGEDEVSALIQQAIDDAGRYRLLPAGVLLEHLARSQQSAETVRGDPALIANAVRDLGAVGLLTGRIARFPAPRGHDRTEIALSLTLYDAKAAPVFEQRFDAQVAPDPLSLAYWRATVASVSVWTRLLAWLALVLALPLALMPLSQRVLARESNTANALLLLSQIAAGTAAAFVALELRVDGAGSALALVLAFLATAFWSFLATSALERYR